MRKKLIQSGKCPHLSWRGERDGIFQVVNMSTFQLFAETFFQTFHNWLLHFCLVGGYLDQNIVCRVVGIQHLTLAAEFTTRFRLLRKILN